MSGKLRPYHTSAILGIMCSTVSAQGSHHQGYSDPREQSDFDVRYADRLVLNLTVLEIRESELEQSDLKNLIWLELASELPSGTQFLIDGFEKRPVNTAIVETYSAQLIDWDSVPSVLSHKNIGSVPDLVVSKSHTKAKDIPQYVLDSRHTKESGYAEFISRLESTKIPTGSVILSRVDPALPFTQSSFEQEYGDLLSRVGTKFPIEYFRELPDGSIYFEYFIHRELLDAFYSELQVMALIPAP